ncbi:hypothetical protein [Methylocystis parvus]|uniref:PepSY domain-containing protein n=1 Tax=Methylocystis parvus TaxID=134 RepID=A0A6B8M7X2_9HYPH|nr:hypothetical protein [Methylocystis parvus]QGM97719.1 hypothetical protein F7D14_09725 [Methylocystis parvus]WBK01978.1 hypothetical protein MMG94_09860 [Methylocystis parvus OBBP]
MSRRILCVLFALACGGAPLTAQAQETPKDIIAAHVRLQGYKCDAPKSARRDAAASRPGEAVWIIACENGSYKVRLIPNMADVIEPF